VPGAFLLDADVPPAVADALRKLGHDAVAASGNPTLEALGDAELLREAIRQDRVLVTFNIADFAEAARHLAQAQEDHVGIILIHSRSYPRTKIGAIARALDKIIRSRESMANTVLYLP
jgi:predicted nuclease of predicted toxin-antitoxin system